jgi:hypothetical protein
MKRLDAWPEWVQTAPSCSRHMRSVSPSGAVLRESVTNGLDNPETPGCVQQPAKRR